MAGEKTGLVIRREDINGEEEKPQQVLSPVNELSPEAIKAMRLRAAERAKEALHSLWRLNNCADCSKLEGRFRGKKKLIAAQVMNRLQGRTPSYCCELEGG